MTRKEFLLLFTLPFIKKLKISQPTSIQFYGIDVGNPYNIDPYTVYKYTSPEGSIVYLNKKHMDAYEELCRIM